MWDGDRGLFIPSLLPYVNHSTFFCMKPFLDVYFGSLERDVGSALNDHIISNGDGFAGRALARGT
jgi:hypothetical protein